MKIIFDNQQEITSPRVYNNINNQRLIFIRIEQLVQKLDSKTYIDPIAQHFTPNVQNKMTGPQTTNKKQMKATNSVAFSEELEVIKHADKKPMRKSSRNPTSITKNSKGRDVNTSSMQKSHMSKMIFNKEGFREEENLEDTTLKFDPDFLLSAVFGYREILIRTPEGIFSIFEPIKRRNYTNEHEFTKNLLNGYKSGSEFSGFEESSVESEDENNAEIRNKGSKKGYKQITPRGIIRRQTNTPYVGVSPRVSKVLKRDQTGNMDWFPQIKSKEPEVLKIPDKLKKNSMMEKSEESSSESELKHSQSAPMNGIDKNNIFELNSLSQSPKHKRQINLNKYRRTHRSKSPRDEDEIHSMVDEISDNKSEDNLKVALKESK